MFNFNSLILNGFSKNISSANHSVPKKTFYVYHNNLF